MFTDAMKESSQSEISLNGITSAGIEYILEYIYTSKLKLNLSNVQDVLSAASHVQLDSVVESCSDYLQSQLDLDNCVDIVTLAETYSLNKLKKKVYRFICANLYEFSKTKEIYRLGWLQLEHILACDFPVDCCENMVLKIVLKWIKLSENIDKNDTTIIKRLLHNVRLYELSHVDIERTFINSLLKTNICIFKLITNIEMSQKNIFKLKHETQSISSLPMLNSSAAHSSTLQSAISETSMLSPQRISHNADNMSLVNSRGMEQALIKIGGFGISGITNEITYFLLSSKKWRHLTSIPHVEQCNYGTAVLGNDLYVVGGCYNVSLEEYIHPFGFRYSPSTNKWLTITPMQQDRCRFSLNFVDGRLYAVGGASEVNTDEDLWNTDESTAERYDPQTDKWEFISPLAGSKTQHAGAAHGGFLYISGGLSIHSVMSSFNRYNTIFGYWEKLLPMLTPRADHVMLTIGNKLYVCGGWYESTSNGNRVLAETIDVYCTDKLCWEVLTTIPTPRYHAGIVAVENKIYFIGGFCSDAMFDRATSSVECYDIINNNWSNIERYPRNIWEHTCVSLYIPKYRDDMEIINDD